MREEELFNLIRQCEKQKLQISGFMVEITEQYPHSVGSSRMKLRLQLLKYNKRKSVLDTRIIRAKMQLMDKGHKIEI